MSPGDEATGANPGRSPIHETYGPDAAGTPGGSRPPVEAGSTPFDVEAEEVVVEAMEFEADLDLLDRISRERDEYLDTLRHLQADFENYKKRMTRQAAEQSERASERLVEKLLAVFDTADLALAHGAGEEVKQVWSALFDTLEREGLERIDTADAPFDPTVHDAVAHDPAEDELEPVVVEVMRAGYRWKGRVLRPAMVRVRG